MLCCILLSINHPLSLFFSSPDPPVKKPSYQYGRRVYAGLAITVLLMVSSYFFVTNSRHGGNIEQPSVSMVRTSSMIKGTDESQTMDALPAICKTDINCFTTPIGQLEVQCECRATWCCPFGEC